MKFFSESEIDFIAEYCEKLEPEARFNHKYEKFDLITFPEHKLCVTKENSIYTINLFEDTLKSTECVIGPMVSGPYRTLDETVFMLLSLASMFLPPELANQLYYEADAETVVRH